MYSLTLFEIGTFVTVINSPVNVYKVENVSMLACQIVCG